MAEFRALRASVVRLWMNSIAGAEPGTLDELARFNDALDEALADAIGHFSETLDRSRELFMGVLGHDLRTPLQVMLQSAEALSRRSERSPAEAPSGSPQDGTSPTWGLSRTISRLPTAWDWQWSACSRQCCS